MSRIAIGGKYKFEYPPEFKTLPDYSAHAGDIVTVKRMLNGDESDFEMYEVQADDGWIGHADECELTEL